MSNGAGVVWYSTDARIMKQAFADERGQTWRPTFAEFPDGRIAEYTEIRRDNSPSPFTDAVRLGEGEYICDGYHCATRMGMGYR